MRWARGGVWRGRRHAQVVHLVDAHRILVLGESLEPDHRHEVAHVVVAERVARVARRQQRGRHVVHERFVLPRVDDTRILHAAHRARPRCRDGLPLLEPARVEDDVVILGARLVERSLEARRALEKGGHLELVFAAHNSEDGVRRRWLERRGQRHNIWEHRGRYCTGAARATYWYEIGICAARATYEIGS